MSEDVRKQIEFLTIKHAMEIFDNPEKIKDDRDEIVLDDHRYVHVWATTKPQMLQEELKERKISIEMGMRKLHEIWKSELLRRHYEHDSPLKFEAPMLEKLHSGLKPFRWRVGGIQWVGSAVKGKNDPNDLDVVIRLNEFDPDLLEKFKSQIPETWRKSIEGIWDSRGSHGPYIEAGDFWFQPAERMRVQIPSYKIKILESILPLFPSRKVSYEKTRILPDIGWIVEPKPLGIRLLIHRRFDKIKAFDREGGEIDVSEELKRDLLAADDPPSFILDGYWMENENIFLISDVLWWRETELIEIPAQNRKGFISKFPDTPRTKKLAYRWCLDGDEISNYLRSLKPRANDEFYIKQSDSEYSLNGVSPRWYLLHIPEKVLKAAAPTDSRIRELVGSSQWEKMKADSRVKLLRGREKIEPLYPYQPLKTSKRGYQIREVFGIKPITELAKHWFKAPNKIAIETKFDAYRVSIHKRGDRVRIFTESGRELSKILPTTVADTKKLKADSCVLDAEQVPYDEEGRALGRRAAAKAFGGKAPIDDKNWVAHVFDILYLNGKDLHTEDYEERRKLLRGLELPVRDVPKEFPPKFHLHENIIDWATSAEMMVKLAKQHAKVKFSEGAMFKQGISKHPLSGTTPLWAKMKTTFEIDAIVLGRKPKMSKATGQAIPGQWTYVGGCGPITKPSEASPKIKDAPVASADEADYLRFRGKLYAVLGDSFGSAEDMKPGDIMRIGCNIIRRINPTKYHWLIPKVLEHRTEKTKPDPLSVAAEIARESMYKVTEKEKKAAFPLESRIGAGSLISSSLIPKQFLGLYVDNDFYYAIIKTPEGIKNFMEKHGAKTYYAREISWSLHEYLAEEGIPVEITDAETIRDALDLWTYIDQETPLWKAQFSLSEVEEFLYDLSSYVYTMSNPPTQIKKLPKGAQRIWISAFNAAFKKWGDTRARKIAWNAVKQVYRKVGEKWVRKALAFSRHALDECMDCPRPPTVEFLWAEGKAHAWFCEKHAKEFRNEQIWHGVNQINYERKLGYGVASKKWKEGPPAEAEAEEYKRTRKLRFQTAGYLVFPDETKIWQFVAQAHIRGLSVHIDIRFEIAKKEKLIGWTMDALKSLIKPMIQRYVSDSQLAGFGLTKARVREMTIREVSEKIRSTTEGKKLYNELSKKADGLPDKILKAMVNQLVRTELIPILQEPEKKILLQIKAPEPYEWLTYEGYVGPGEVGATKEHPGKFFIVDRGSIEFGSQKSHYHEYWLHGKLFKDEHFVVRRLPTREKWRLKSPFAWMGFFTKPEKLPYVISRRAVKLKYMPPIGKSALPKVIRNQIPEQYRYWTAKDGGRARDIRAALVEAIKKREVKLRFAAGLRFAVKRMWYRGPVHVRGAPTVLYYMIFHDGKRVVKAWDFGQENPREHKSVSTRLGKSKDPKLIQKTVDLSPSHILNPTEKLQMHVDTIDEGSVSVIADSANFMRFRMGGGIFKGIHVLVRETPGSAEWFFRKAELPKPVKKQMFGSYSGLVSLAAKEIESKQVEDLLVISGPFLRPGEMIGLDMRPSFFPPSTIEVVTSSAAGAPIIVMHGDLKGDVVGYVSKVSVRMLPHPKTGKVEPTGYCDSAIIWHPKAIDLIRRQILPDFSIELMPRSVWDPRNQREVVLGGRIIGLGIVTRGAGEGLHIDRAVLVQPAIGPTKRELKLRKRFGQPLKQYVHARYWRDEYSYADLSRDLGMSKSAVINLFQTMEIPRRNLSEAAAVRKMRERSIKKFGGAVTVSFLGTGCEQLFPRSDCECPQCQEARKGGPSRRNHSSLMLTYGGETLVIDAPDEIVEMLALRKIRPQYLLITHGHPDHSAGLKNLTSTQLNVFATNRAWKDISDVKDMPFKKRVVTPNQRFQIAGFVVTPHKVAHSTVCPTIAYKIRVGERTLFYAPDVLDIPNKTKILKDVDIYIGDGSSLNRTIVRKDKRGTEVGHASMKEQISWAQKAEIPEVLFTHIGHTKLTQKDLNAKLRKMAPNSLAMADGASFLLTDENPGHKLPEGHAKLLWEGKKRIIVTARPYMKYATRVIFFIDEDKVYGRMVEGFPEGPFDAKEVKEKFKKFHRITDDQWKKWFGGQKKVYIYRPRIIAKFDEPLPYKKERGQQVYIRNVKIFPQGK